MKVTLREKRVSNGKKSLYLDYYPPILKPETGKQTRREFLNLFLYEKPKNEIERRHNKDTKLLAENVCAKRQLELQAGNYGFLTKSQKTADFLKYFQKIVDKRSTSKTTGLKWNNTYLHFFDYAGGVCTFERLTPKFVEGFRDYLLTCKSRISENKLLAQNTASAYFQNFCAVLNHAIDDRFLLENPARSVAKIKTIDANREYLSIEELQKLAQIVVRMPDVLRRAALFAGLTGMRFSDIRNLKWENVHFSRSTGHYLQFRSQKTNENQTLPISDEARELMLDADHPNAQVFKGLDYTPMTNVYIGRWTLAAGITKSITFHSFRHTYATALLTLGTDLYTVSKMLGHKSISKTQIYARIIDEKKREAASKITLK